MSIGSCARREGVVLAVDHMLITSLRTFRRTFSVGACRVASRRAVRRSAAVPFLQRQANPLAVVSAPFVATRAMSDEATKSEEVSGAYVR